MVLKKQTKKLLILYLLYRRHKVVIRPHRRKYWVHPILQNRENFGVYKTLYNELRSDPKKIFNFFRMSISTFDELHVTLKEEISRKDTKMRKSIGSEEMLAIAIR